MRAKVTERLDNLTKLLDATNLPCTIRKDMMLPEYANNANRESEHLKRDLLEFLNQHGIMPEENI